MELFFAKPREGRRHESQARPLKVAYSSMRKRGKRHPAALRDRDGLRGAQGRPRLGGGSLTSLRSTFPTPRASGLVSSGTTGLCSSVCCAARAPLSWGHSFCSWLPWRSSRGWDASSSPRFNEGTPKSNASLTAGEGRRGARSHCRGAGSRGSTCRAPGGSRSGADHRPSREQAEPRSLRGFRRSARPNTRPSSR